MTPVRKLVEIGEDAYTLSFNFGSIRLAEAELGQPVFSVMKTDEPLSLNAVSAIWWSTLQAKHRMTREGADALVDKAGVDAVIEWVITGLGEYITDGKAKPEPEEKPGKAGSSRGKPRAK